MRFRVWALLAVLLAAMLVSAQVNNGVISGTVRDKAGAVVAGATVTARNLDTSFERTVQTNSQGYFILPALPLGPYEVTITSQDFAAFKDRAQVTVGGLAVVDAVLGVAAASTTVEVSAQAAAVEVNTQTQEQSQIVSEEQIAQLPSLTRNPYDFIAVSGNVSGGDRSSQSGNPQTSGGGQNSSDRGVGFNINGQRASGTEILLDGMENSNIFDTTISLLIPQDAVQEFRVVTNNFDAQYGRASGGVVNVSTKSGTNNFHGSAWEFNRLSAYTANTYDNNSNGIAKGNYTRNQYGFTFGGPAIKNKLFFFGSTEWLRVRSNASLLGYVPTSQFISATPQNVQDYFAKNGGTLPFISTVTKADLAGKYVAGGAFDTAIPNPATPIFGLVNYFAPSDAGGDNPQNTYYMLVRGDYTYSDRTQFTFRYGRESLGLLPGSSFNSPYAQYNVGFTLVNDTYLGTATHSFTQNLLSTTRAGFSRDVRQNQYNTALHDTPTLFLYNGASLGGQPVTLPGFYNNFTGTGGLPYGGPQNTVQIFEDLAWSKNTHTIRFGGQYDYIQMNKSYGAYAQAVQQLGTSFAKGLEGMTNGLVTNFQAAVYPQGKLPCVRDFLTQTLIQTPACTVELPATQPSFARSYRYNDWALYAQDSWRASAKLTLNYGVRYEHYGVQHNGDPNLDSNLYFGPGSNTFEQLRTASIQLAPKSAIGGLWAPQWGTVAPRVGFAYDIFGNGTTSFRAGYGISYERNFGNVTFNMIQNPPNYATVQLHNVPVTVSNFGPLGTGTGAVALPPVSPRQVTPNIRTAQTQFWGAGIERQLWRNAILSIDYNGAHGVHLYDIKNINPLGGAQAYLGDPLVTTAACGGPCYARPNGQFTSVNNRGNLGYSHYNGVNVRFQTQSWGKTGLSILSNYTWAHALDNLSSTFAESSSSSNGVGNLGYMNPAFPQFDYGSSDFDVRNRFVFSAVWSDPFYTSGKGWQRQVLGGWTITPLFSARTGIPFTVSDSTNSLNATTGPYGIPRYVPTGAYGAYTRGGIAIGPNNYNILELPVANSYVGNFGISDFGPYPANMTGRNQFRGPGAWSFDMAVTKSFQLTERFNLQFRADSFDVFNHHNMYVNGFVADAALFPGAPVVIQGKKGGLGAAANNGNHDERRFVQFALKLAF